MECYLETTQCEGGGDLGADVAAANNNDRCAGARSISGGQEAVGVSNVAQIEQSLVARHCVEPHWLRIR